MNKTVIKNFAVWARRKLISEITYKAGLLGITEKGITAPLPQSTKDLQFFDVGTRDYTSVSGNEIKQRDALVWHIKQKENSSDYKTAFQSVVEETAYTWFNRLIAIRFMEVNDYLPSRIRVLSSENSQKLEPDFVTNPFDTDLEFSAYERDRIMQLKDENKLDELFRMLFIKQCNKLNDNLPELFEKTYDYTELLLTISFTDKDGIVYHLVHDIEDDNFNVEKEGQVEIIGWLYQYYNSEPKDEVFALLKKNVKITKERIPAATQLFTPDWIVRYMVENSLGRLWIEHQNASARVPEHLNGIYFGWKYYLEEAEQEPDVEAQLAIIREDYKNMTPEDIKIIDPCMGSGHILVYAFDVLMQIYESYGYTGRDAAVLIVEKNLYGLDIDDRAYQLAYFAVMMKGRQYDRRFLTKGISPNLCTIKESNGLNSFEHGADQLNLDDYYKEIANSLIDAFKDAKEYGSILNIESHNYDGLMSYLEKLKTEGAENLFISAWINNISGEIPGLIKQAKIMSQKYDVVMTNPPYMGGNGMSGKLSDFLKNKYPSTKSDLFAAFIEKGNSMAKKCGYNCMVTMQSWMFLSSFEKMREDIVLCKTISNLMHMENMVMGIAFGTAVANFRNCHIRGFKGTYNHIKACDIDNGEPKEFPVQGNRFAQVSTENFAKIPSMPIAYWVSEEFIGVFDKGSPLGRLAISRNGMKTGENERFLRLWQEVNIKECYFKANDYSDAVQSNAKWFPYNKGGEYRKWYGNNDYIVNWKNEGEEIFVHAKTDKRNVQDYPKELKFTSSASWGLISSGQPSFRYKESNLSDIAGMSFYTNKKDVLYFLGFCNTPISTKILEILAPTINYQAGDIGRLPIIKDEECYQNILEIVEQNITLSKNNWDSFETSWDFKRHPLTIGYGINPQDRSVISVMDLCNEPIEVEYHFENWRNFTNQQFIQLKTNEEELNHIFIEIYGLQDELTPEVEDKGVTIRKADLGRDIRSFISYSVGCMFGRYSPLKDGLVFAGGDWDYKKITDNLFDAIGKNEYTQRNFVGSLDFIDEDNCIPITDEEYFRIDIVGKFVEFVNEIYGDESLEENLDFIANALGNKGNTSREVIRNYFIKDFYKDHCKIYQKRPIYWLFDSGKEDGFKALIYMHRYNADTIGTMRIDYLHRMQKIYESEISRMQETIDNSTNVREVATAEKRKEKLIKQFKETKDYDQKIAHLALARIEIDLDDGIKVNYEKVQTGTDGKKLDVLGKI